VTAHPSIYSDFIIFKMAERRDIRIELRGGA
jgi:hypothetical protein